MAPEPRVTLSRILAVLVALAAPVALAADAPAATPAEAPAQAAVALQPLWTEFERLRLPAASATENAQPLEDVLNTLRRREESCAERLPHAASLRKHAEELQAALDRGGADLEPADVPARLQKCGEGIEVTMPPNAARGEAFELLVTGPGAASGIGNALPCATTALPTWRLTRVEASADGWTASGQLSLLAGTSAPAPLPELPEKSKGESRRSSELRMRVTAVRPGVEACEKKLHEAGIAGIDERETRVEATDHLRARDSIVRPATLLAVGLSNVAATRPRTLVVKEVGDQVQLEISPLAAGISLRKKLRTSGTGIRAGAETFGNDTVSLVITRRQTPRTLVAAGKGTDDESLARLLELMKAVRTRGASTVSQLEPDLAAASRALLEDAELVGGYLDDARTIEDRVAAARTALESQGIFLTDEQVDARVAACNAKLSGKRPKRGAEAVSLVIEGSLETSPNVPWACLRAAFRSLTLQKFVRSAKTWKLTVGLFLDPAAQPVVEEKKPAKKGKNAKAETAAPAAAETKPATVEGLVTLPPVPAAPLAQPKSRHPDAKPWRAKLLELHAFLKAQHERLATIPLAAADQLEHRYDTLSTHETWTSPLDSFAATVFTPPEGLELPPWMDFVVDGTEVKLNLAPKDRALGLMSALRTAGCRTLKTKNVGDSLRAEIACGPKAN